MNEETAGRRCGMIRRWKNDALTCPDVWFEGESGVQDDVEVLDQGRESDSTTINAERKSLEEESNDLRPVIISDLLELSLKLLFIRVLCQVRQSVGGKSGRSDGFCGYIKLGIDGAAVKLEPMAV